MTTLIQDLRYALRRLAKNPGFTAVAVITLALGIGANTTIFSILNGILFTPGPFADEDRVVYLTGGNERSARPGQVSYSEFTECQKQNQVFDRIAVFAAEEANLDGPGEPVSVKTVKASADLISLLRANPMLGRVFLPEEYSPGRNRVVLLSNALWRRLGSRSDLAGMTMDLDGHPHAVVGVLPSDLKVSRGLGFEPEIWMPLAPEASDAPGSRYLFAVARLKAGISLERGRADLEVISRRLEQQAPTTDKGWKVTADKLKAEVDPIAYVFLTVLVASVLGIACANVTNLLLAQATAREREISMRSAMGATRLRLVRQLLTECLLLATLGAGLGVLVAQWACDLITTLSTDTNAGTMPIEVSPRVLLGTLGLLVVAGVTVGLAPALQVNRINLTQSLKGGSRSNPLTFSRWSVKDVFVVSEVAMSVLLLGSAGLIIKSWFRLVHLDSGFQPQKVLTMNVSLPAARYPQPHQQSTFFDQLLGRLESRSEIQFAAVADSLPTASASESFWIEGTPKPIAGEEPQARFTTASHRYFQALSIALKSGRFFTAKDAANAAAVAIINEAMVRKYWASGNPVGARLEIAKQIRSIVGVVGDVKSIPLSRNPVPEVYVPFSQNPVNQVSLLVRAARRNPLDIAQAVKNEVQAVDPRQAVSRVRTMEKALSQNMGVINLGSLLMAVLAVGGLVLAAVGTYGVLSYAVAQRAREFGIRIALGALPGDVLGIVMKRGMALTLVGALLGVVGALAVARFLASRIYGLSSLEVFIPLSVTSLLVIVALAACYIPARRATKVDPMVALRHE
jgi:putative ABC transport system permease protein